MLLLLAIVIIVIPGLCRDDAFSTPLLAPASTPPVPRVLAVFLETPSRRRPPLDLRIERLETAAEPGGISTG